jgi:hypothetical protein
VDKDTPYQEDRYDRMHHGAIYEYRPVFWLEPPLWILRDYDWSLPHSVNFYQETDLPNPFRRGSEGNEEDVIARAKRRHVIILSNNFDIQHPAVKEVIVAPMYTLHLDKSPTFIEAVRQNEVPRLFYLPAHRDFPEARECYVDFLQVRALNKRFLVKGKLGFCLSQESLYALLERYNRYLSTVVPIEFTQRK